MFSTWRYERPRLVGRARKRLGTTEGAEDVVQDAAVAALVRASTLRDVRCADAWVARIVDRKASDAARADGRRARVRRDIEDAEDVALEPVAAPCFCARVQARRLKRPYAQVLERVDERGESIAAVAAALGVTPNTLTVRLCRARALLRATLKAHCGTMGPQSCADCGCLQRRCCVPVDDEAPAS